MSQISSCPKATLLRCLFDSEKAITIVDSLIDLACIQRKTTNRPKISFDEWNVWDPALAPGELGAEMKYDITDALAVSTFVRPELIKRRAYTENFGSIQLNVFLRQSQKVRMANIAQVCNL